MKRFFTVHSLLLQTNVNNLKCETLIHRLWNIFLHNFRNIPQFLLAIENLCLQVRITYTQVTRHLVTKFAKYSSDLSKIKFKYHQVCDTHGFAKSLTRTPSGLKNWHTSCKTFLYINCCYLDDIKNWILITSSVKNSYTS